MAIDNPSYLTCWKEKGVAGDGTCQRLAEYGHCRNCPEYSQAGRSMLDREIPPGFREEWAKTLAGGKETEAPGAVSLVVFRLNDEHLALKTMVFVQALALRPIHRVPFRTNRMFLGIVNVDGVLLPCLSVAEVLGITAPDQRAANAEGQGYRRLMVVSRDGERFVFPVDEVLGVMLILPTQLQKPPQTISKSAKALTLQVFQLNSRSVGLLDDAKLLEIFQGSLTH